MIPNNDLNNRESLVMDFISARNKELRNQDAIDKLNSSPEVVMRKLGEEKNKATSVCLDHFLGKVYKDALPFDDPKRKMSDDDASSEMRHFVSQRTDGHNSEYYFREALKRNKNNKIADKLLTESQKIAKKFYAENAKDIGKIDIKCLTFNPALHVDDINDTLEKLDSEGLSAVIAKNVKAALDEESERASKEAEYNKSVEDSLTSDTSITDSEAMESALRKMHPLNQPRVYQASLMESVLMHMATVMPSASKEDIITEAVREYTKLSIAKALKLENFNILNTKALANSYL